MNFTPEQAAMAQHQAEQLKVELMSRILGKQFPGFKCNCGAIHCSEAKAVDMDYPGESYDASFKTMWYLWTVGMQEIAHPEKKYSIGLDQFLSEGDIGALFAQYFGNLVSIAESRGSSNGL